MNQLKIFENKEFGQIRTIEIDDEPWFVGKDVADVLGYERPTKAIMDHVDDDDRRGSSIGTSDQLRNMVVINESGVYSLIFGSKLPTAKRFKHWVTSEVLPTIRKHGAYATAPTIDKILSDPDYGIKLLQSLKEERERCAALETKIKEMRPKEIFTDAVSASSTSILIGDLAKLIKQNGQNIGQKRLFQWLRDNGYLIKRKGADYNSPTQKAMDLGLFEIKETTIVHSDGHVSINKTPKVTGKGQVYFINKFLDGKENRAD